MQDAIWQVLSVIAVIEEAMHNTVLQVCLQVLRLVVPALMF